MSLFRLHRGLRGRLRAARRSTTGPRRTYLTVEALESRILLDSSADQLFVKQLYGDLLHREADAGGLAAWTNLLSQGAPRSHVVQGFEASTEFRTGLVQDLYHTLLLRPAEPAGLTSHLAFLNAGGTVEQLTAGILGSPEYFQNRGGGTNTGFLQAVYHDVLGRNVDPAGQTAWTSMLTYFPRFLVAEFIVDSREAQQDLLQSFYQRYLHRAVDPAGQGAFVHYLQQGIQVIFSKQLLIAGSTFDPIQQTTGKAELLGFILGSEEYFTLATAVAPPINPCAFDDQLTGWTVHETGGSAAGHGTVVAQNGDAILRERDSFTVSLERTFTIPAAASALTISYDQLNFDRRAQNQIKDAFEAAFVDSAGNPLVQTISPGKDAFFNISAGQAPALAAGVTLNGQMVTVNLAGLAPGSRGTLLIRLVNSDTDVNTSVHITCVQFEPASDTSPVLVTPAAALRAAAGQVDFSTLADVSPSFVGNYGRTTFRDNQTSLYADLAIKDIGTYLIDVPLVVEIKHLSDPAVIVSNADGAAPDGTPYFNFTALVPQRTLRPGDVSQAETIAFFNPHKTPFTYDLVVLGQLNRPPVFTSQPNTEGIPGVPYVYSATATDPDGDPLTFSLLSGPNGMAVDAATGKVTWSPQQGDLGTHPLDLRVDDGRGGVADQLYAVSVIVAPPNRPPVFTSSPVVDANVNTPYTYQATARDPDGDPLTFSPLQVMPIAVTNAGFEADVLGSGGFLINSLAGWTISGPAQAGPFHPTSVQFAPGVVPEGNNVAYSNGAAISQMLGATLAADTDYALQVDVGHRLDVAFPGYHVQLEAGGTILAEDASQNPGPGQFATATVHYHASRNDPLLGQHLEIRLLATDQQVDFDNVRLTANVSLPQGLTIDAASGLVKWTPAATQLGINHVVLQVSDGRGGIATQAYDIGVQQEKGNLPPAIVSQPVTSLVIPGVFKSQGGSIFLTGHDPDFHSLNNENETGAEDIIKAAVRFVTDPTFNTFAAGGIHKFLFVESSIAVPGGHLDTEAGLVASGFTPGVDFDKADASTLNAALDQLGKSYDAIVVASDFGGILTQAELDILDARSADIIHFLNAGGGLFAMAESDSGAGLTPHGGQFGFLPFVVSSLALNQVEVGNTVTSDGAALGLTNADINGNASHNIFKGTFGLHVVDFDNQGHILSLAGRGPVSTGGVAAGPPYTYPLRAVDADNDPLTYSLTTGPQGMTIDSKSGLITWAGPSVGSGGSPGPKPVNGLVLSAAGTAAGFSLTDFAHGFPNANNIGPLGIAFPDALGGNKVLVSDYPGNVRLFPADSDGQDAAFAPLLGNLGFSNAIGLAQVNGKLYMTQQGKGDVVRINPDGSVAETIALVDFATGIVANPTNGHLFVSNAHATIFDVDPTAHSATPFVGGLGGADGLTISPDGNTLYAALTSDQHIVGFDTHSGNRVFVSGSITLLDGTALGFGSLAGFVFANTNNGQVWQVDLNNPANPVLIASGGSRGDFVSVDPNDGTLLLTQTDNIVRLHPPAGASFAQEFKVTARVDDGRGASDTQSYTIHVSSNAALGGIQGTVFNDLNGNGTRDPINAPPAPTGRQTTTVPGTSDPYLAGMPAGSTADGGDVAPDQSPALVGNATLTAGSALMFTVASGLVNNVPSFGGPGANGDGFTSHTAGAQNGIANVAAPLNSLLGVFLGPDQPDASAAPATLDFSSSGNVPGGTDYATLSPQLKQVFFIGNGRTSSGAAHQVIVPAGATRLFLATMDSRQWNDNTGSYSVKVEPFSSKPPPAALKLVSISTPFNSPIGIDFYEPDNSYIVSVNSPGGQPHNFDEILADGSHVQFSNVSGLTDEVYIATARSGDLGGFKPGDLFVGNGQDGQIARITDGGKTLINPWVVFPGTNHGFLRGDLHFDRTGVFGGDLIVATGIYPINDFGEIWRVDSAGHATKLAKLGTLIEGLTTVPDDPATYGPLAGKIVAGAELQGGIYTIDTAGKTAFIPTPGVEGPEDLSLIPGNQNWFGVNFGTSKILGADPAAFSLMAGDILLTGEFAGGGSSGLYHVYWDGKTVRTERIPQTADSPPIGLWEDGTFAPAGISEVPPVQFEPGLPGWTVYIDLNHDGKLDPGEPFTTTDAQGRYSFSNLAPGTYTIAEVGQPGWKQTAPAGDGTATVTIKSGQVASGIDFGNTQTNVGNRAPKFRSTPPVTATASQTYRYSPTVSNPDGQPLTFDLPLHPIAMAADPITGAIVWIPTATQFGPQQVILRMQDSRGDVVLQPFQVTVSVNTPPVITSQPPGPAVVGLPYVYHVRAQDAQGGADTFRLDTAPSGMAIDAATGNVTYTATASQVGSQHVAIVASDVRGAETSQAFDLAVVTSAPDRPPVITSTPPNTIRLGSKYFYPVEASDPDGDPLTFHLDTPPAGMTIDASGTDLWQPRAAQFGPNPVTIRVEDGRGGSATQSFTVNVVDQGASLALDIISTPPFVATVNKPYAYNPEAANPQGNPLVWSLDAAPVGMSIDPRSGAVRWTPAALQIGTQNVAVHVRDSQGGEATQSFAITVRGVNVPPLVTSTPPTVATVGQGYTYAVGASDADGDPLTFTLQAAPAGMTIDPASGLVQWAPDATQVGPQNVTTNVDDGQGGTAQQTYTVVVSQPVPDTPPVITSFPSMRATVGQLYTHQVVAHDTDGDTLHYQLLAPPQGMTIDPAGGLIQWTPDRSALASFNGNQVIVEVSDPAGHVVGQIYGIRVQDTNQPPAIASAPVAQITAGLHYRYDVKASDPDGDPLSYTLKIGPQGMTIDAFGRIAWSTGTADIGTHHVDIKVDDGRGLSVDQAYDLVVAADTEPPRVSLGVSTNPVDVGAAETFFVSATDNVGVQKLTLTVGGTAVPLDANGQATMLMNKLGSLDVVATATDAAGNTGTATGAVLVIDPTDTAAPVVDLTSPADGAVVTAPTDIIGTVTDSNLLSYKLEVAPFAGGAFIKIGGGTTPVTNGVLGKFDPSMLANDSYILRLNALNAGGHSASTQNVISVAGNLKLGDFTLSFTDLSIPVTGIPIHVSRTYDTRNAGTSGDFGFGWRLEFRDINVRSSVAPTGMEADGIYNPFRDNTRVYITVPGGTREGFTFQPQINRVTQFLIPVGLPQEDWQYDPVFVPDAGVTDQLTLSGATTLIRDSSTGEYFSIAGGRIPFNPADSLFFGTYNLTTKNGIAYKIDAPTGNLLSVTDANGNTLTYSDAGVASSAGKQVTFQRDAQGRIASVTDPGGKQVLYQYDAQGDLVAVTDRDGNVTKLVYRTDRPHYLDQVIDPLGRTGARAEYDSNGRLAQVVNAAGNTVQLTYDPDHSIGTVVDALGNTTTYEYDQQGNILTEIDALGGIIRSTYDANNHLLTRTDPLGHTSSFSYDNDGNILTRTDPLGNVTRSTYVTFTATLFQQQVQGARPVTEVLTTTDPLGNTSSNTYDGSDNLLSSTDAAGNVTRYRYDGGGSNPTSVRDATGSVTRYEYDGSGNLIRGIDALGNATTFTYDGNGNQLTQTTTVTGPTGPRTLVTATTYDANGNPTSVTDAEGHVTRTEYDALSRRSATIDPLGRRTEFRYDVQGRLVQTLYADGTSSSQDFDAAGQRIASTDRAGRTTHFEYDALGRLISTIYPDSTPLDLSDNPRTRTEYNAAGQITAQVDERGNRTEFEYDADNRQTIVRDALGHETLNRYDAAGYTVAFEDALGRTSHFAYDPLGHVVQMTFADGTKNATAYDALGHVIAQIDQSGQTTRSEYDPLGRLTAVVDALGQRTEYGYDEAGDLVSQRDANGHVTRYEYDGLGHRIATVQPLGQRATTSYDPAGNASSVSDFNGATTHYVYDSNNQLSAEQLPDGTSIIFTYTPTGRRASVNGARGLTTYAYDDRDRLLSRTEPDGERIAYTYDAVGNETSVTTAAGTTAYSYDAMNLLQTVTGPGEGVTRYTYDAFGNLIKTDLPNGTVETRSYNELNRLVFLENTGPGGVIASYRYTLDPSGHRTQVDEDAGRRVKYTYDALYRLLNEQITDPSAGDRTTRYTYDPVGNRMTRDDSAEGVTAYTYDGNDRLLTETLAGQIARYTYDDNGNTLSRVKSATDQAFYHWDSQNRLVGADVTDTGGTRHIAYAYDADGIRVASTVDGQETRFLADANRGFAQVLMEYAPGGTIMASYVYGNRLISQNRSGQVSFYHVDAQGSTRALSDAAGGVTDRYVYDAFGRTIGRTGTTVNAYLFAGEQRDSNIALDYLRARYLNSETGRFMSRDSFDGELRTPVSLNRYGYALGNPVSNRDPSGRQTLIETLVGLFINDDLEALEFGRGIQLICKVKSIITGLESVGIIASLLALRYFEPFEGIGGGINLQYTFKEPESDDFDRIIFRGLREGADYILEFKFQKGVEEENPNGVVDLSGLTGIRNTMEGSHAFAVVIAFNLSHPERSTGGGELELPLFEIKACKFKVAEFAIEASLNFVLVPAAFSSFKVDLAAKVFGFGVFLVPLIGTEGLLNYFLSGSPGGHGEAGGKAE